MAVAGRLPPGSGRPTRAEIDLQAFTHNLRLARRLGGKGREVMAVVKADAYGHGAVPLARQAVGAGAACLGVATVGEARQLREAGIREPVVILSEVAPGAEEEVVRLECTQVLFSLRAAELLERAAGKAGRRVAVHLKVDTGMGRIGLPPQEAASFALRLAGMPHLLLEGVLTHLSEADSLESGATLRQLREFARICSRVKKSVRGLRFLHTANSALLMRQETIGNLTRPGIMLYGSPPAPGFPGEGELRQVMRFVTGISFLKKVPAGTALSYGGTFVTKRKSLIATLPVGYADGYTRRLSNRVDVLVRGKRAPQVGTICMDMCLVDVSAIPGVSVGDEVVLLGGQGEENVRAEELARNSGTISYEIYCAVGARVPRVYGGAGRGGA
jgi:alanine racemase